MDRDLAFGTASLVISVGYYWTATFIPESQLADAIGPKGLPTMYAFLLGGLSLMLIGRSLSVRGRLKPAATTAESRLPPDTAMSDNVGSKPTSAKDGARRAVGTLLIGFLYIAAVPWLGYVVSLAGLLFATIWYKGAVVNRQVFIVSIAGAVFCWVLFVLLMGIPQPSGLWPSLL